jgi:hypothetical protein
MKYLSTLILSSLILPAAVQIGLAQQPVKRPVRNPPQYPNIIDLDNKESPAAASGESAEDKALAIQTAQSEALLKAVESLTGEMRSLVREIRTMNLRQQTQLDITRVSGLGPRMDGLNGELRGIRERLSSLSVDEQNLGQLMTRESLISQSSIIGTLDREKTMEQIRTQHDTKLRFILADKERLQRTENELIGQLQYYQNLQEEAEKRIRMSEDLIRRLEESRELQTSETKVVPKPQQKPQQK